MHSSLKYFRCSYSSTFERGVRVGTCTKGHREHSRINSIIPNPRSEVP